MAKFRNGSLVLTQTQTIIQGSNTVLDGAKKGFLSAIQLDVGTSIDGAFVSNSDGYLYANRVYNAYFNDIADFQKVIGQQIPGKCYYDTIDGALVCTSRCQKSVIGILSDTYGIAAGYRPDDSYAPIAIAGWVLAFVDGVCDPGDVLTSNSNGNLVKMTREEKLEYSERIVAIYKKPEFAEFWGTESVQLLVNGRHWVKVR